MNVLALIECADHVCYRYRIEPFAWTMAHRGFYLLAEPIRRGTIARVRQLRAAARADLVILQRKLLPMWQLALLRRAVPHLVFDFDDAVYQRDSYGEKGPVSRMRSMRFWATVFAADAVIAGNEHLGARAAAYAGSDRVHVVPTCIEPRSYRPAEHVDVGSSIRLVWIGQQSTLPSLRCGHEQLAAAARRLPGLSIRLICDHTTDLSPLRTTWCPWSQATEAADLARADIGISWLPDDTWSRGKCGLKVLQYMAAGLPVVANPVGMNRRMIVHEETGLLAETPREWADAIERLAADPALRRRMGAAGRRMVVQRYSVEAWQSRLVDVIEAAANSPGGSTELPRQGIDDVVVQPPDRRQTA